MKIQNLLLPEIGICTEEGMFFRKEKRYPREVELISADQALRFSDRGTCDFDTYFNGLSVGKWKKYTTIGNIFLKIYLKGSFEVNLINSQLIGGKVYRKTISSQTIQTDKKGLFTFSYKLYEFQGMLAFSLRALETGSMYFGGWYDADIAEETLQETNIAINICTFKREPFVQRNIDILCNNIINNPENPLYGHLQVYISDNGKTLDQQKLNSDFVHIVGNKNVGGSGGFTRGLIEIMHHLSRYPATHALMMDDDIIIEPEALFRTYMLLRTRKPEYRELFIGGAMLRLDDQAAQVEAGASWNAGNLISNKQDLSMKKLKDCLINEEEEYTEFNAWWYCCIPMSIVTPKNLPLPIFIRGDDLEYGLRNIKHLVLLNGICVWHEAFENKYSSFLQYYILRNLLYDNALHFPEYSSFSFCARLYKNVAREIVYYRYKNIHLIYQGINDFYKGVDFLKTTDGEQLHQKIMASGYKSVPLAQINDAAFHIEAYEDSLSQTDNRFSKLIRYITLNGYLLPARKIRTRQVKVVSMAQCRPINFYREKIVLNYDPASKKGFVTYRSWKETLHALFLLIPITFKTLFRFNHAKRRFKQRVSEITSEEFWQNYLGLTNPV